MCLWALERVSQAHKKKKTIHTSVEEMKIWHPQETEQPKVKQRGHLINGHESRIVQGSEAGKQDSWNQRALVNRSTDLGL